jgi:hypothetical protein
MNTVILHMPDDIFWSPDEILASVGGAKNEAGSVVLERNGSWVSVLRCDDVIDDYEEPARKILDGFFQNRKSYIIEWRNLAVLKDFFALLPQDERVIIDNDRGDFSSLKAICNG